MNYPIVIGNEAAGDKFGGLLGFPTSVLLSRDGKQVKRITGLITKGGLYPADLAGQQQPAANSPVAFYGGQNIWQVFEAGGFEGGGEDGVSVVARVASLTVVSLGHGDNFTLLAGSSPLILRVIRGVPRLGEGTGSRN